MAQRRYYVYILSSHRRVLYTGVTSDLVRRVWQHKRGETAGFTSRYRVDRLVYVEDCLDPRQAIEREKQIKGWSRQKKVDLVRQTNPGWDDLSAEWYD